MFVSYVCLVCVVLMKIEMDIIMLFSCSWIFNITRKKKLWEIDEINNLWLITRMTGWTIFLLVMLKNKYLKTLIMKRSYNILNIHSLVKSNYDTHTHIKCRFIIYASVSTLY